MKLEIAADDVLPQGDTLDSHKSLADIFRERKLASMKMHEQQVS